MGFLATFAYDVAGELHLSQDAQQKRKQQAKGPEAGPVEEVYGVLYTDI
jgi:hypothetical protein